MLFVVRVTGENGRKTHKVFRHKDDAEQFFRRGSVTLWRKEEVPTREGDSTILSLVELFQAQTNDVRRARDEVEDGRAELLASEDGELDVDLGELLAGSLGEPSQEEEE